MSGTDSTQTAALMVNAVELETAGMTRRKDDLLSTWGEGSVKTGSGQVGKLPQVASIGVNDANLINLVNITGEDDAA
ncbi:MAG: hypothetical protein Fur0021_20740 [Candidatus Promineifilaceae bacterium]